MTQEITPTRAYDLLEENEREIVESYVIYAKNEQARKRERIIHALYAPIPYEYIRRSKDALYRPLVRAALAERIREEAEKQDISRDRLIQEFANIAFSDVGDFLESSGFGEYKVKDLTKIEPSKRGAVKSIETKPTAFGLHTKVVLHDKHPALKAMAEFMGLIAPDNPPALQDYVTPINTDNRNKVESAPEQAYVQLLEFGRGG